MITISTTFFSAQIVPFIPSFAKINKPERSFSFSISINLLVAIEGTGLENNQELDSIEMIRMIATARILMPKSKIRLSAGREKLSKEAQILCFQCGANSIFYGDELLTTSNPSFQSDRKLLKEIGVSFNKDFETCEKTLSSS